MLNKVRLLLIKSDGSNSHKYNMQSKILNPQDPRVIKTKKQFKKAFKELMLVYDDFMSITVKELCDKAGLNRKTFYLHYKQVDELLLEVQDEYIEEFYLRIKNFDFYDDVEKIIQTYFEMNEGDPVYKKIATTSVYFFTRELSRKKTVEYMANKGKTVEGIDEKGPIMDFLSYYYDMAIYIMYKRWVLKKRPIPMDEAVALTAALLKDGIPEPKKIK